MWYHLGYYISGGRALARQDKEECGSRMLLRNPSSSGTARTLVHAVLSPEIRRRVFRALKTSTRRADPHSVPEVPHFATSMSLIALHCTAWGWFSTPVGPLLHHPVSSHPVSAATSLPFGWSHCPTVGNFSLTSLVRVASISHRRKRCNSSFERLPHCIYVELIGLLAAMFPFGG